MRTAPLALAAVALATGCFGGEEKQSSGCPPADRLASSVCGDVDGDGNPDRVGLAMAKVPRLVVRSRDGDLSFEIEEFDRFPPPRVDGLAPIDQRRGLEIVATLQQGASTSFASVFTVQHGRLLRMTLPGHVYGDTFAYNGSVTHFDWIDCARARPGVVVTRGFGFGVLDVRSYRVEGTQFRLIRKTERRVGSLAPEHAAEPPQPFPSCMRVRPG